MFEYQSVVDLAQKAERDGALRQALERCQSADEAARVAVDAGVPVSAEQLRAFGDYVQKLRQRAAGEELSDAELEVVAGGSFRGGLLGFLGVGGGTPIGGVGLGTTGRILGGIKEV